MSTVYISSEYKSITELLAKHNQANGRPIFPTNMHLFIFAAMVGSYTEEEKPLDPNQQGNEIPDTVFKNNNLDSCIYLLALHRKHQVDILREKHDKECWGIAESYANAGFANINEWLLDNPTDTNGVETVLTKMKEIAKELFPDETKIDKTKVNF